MTLCWMKLSRWSMKMIKVDSHKRLKNKSTKSKLSANCSKTVNKNLLYRTSPTSVRINCYLSESNTAARILWSETRTATRNLMWFWPHSASNPIMPEFTSTASKTASSGFFSKFCQNRLKTTRMWMDRMCRVRRKKSCLIMTGWYLEQVASFWWSYSEANSEHKP